MAWLAAGLVVVVVGAVVALLLAERWRRRALALTVENERWRRIARERADRVSVVSHEIQTPLALIGGASELLADGTAGALTPQQAALVDTIGVKTSEMATLAADLLADARIDAQIFHLRTTSVDVGRVARAVVRDLRHLYPNQITYSARGAAARILGDQELIAQALTNLVTNSARHAGADARIAVRVRRTDGGVLVSVSDDGTGMSPEQTRDLFRRTLAGKSPSGHGLGMLITQRIVELHGGRCLVDSMSEAGTTILCSLPSGLDDSGGPGDREPDDLRGLGE